MAWPDVDYEYDEYFTGDTGVVVWYFTTHIVGRFLVASVVARLAYFVRYRGFARNHSICISSCVMGNHQWLRFPARPDTRVPRCCLRRAP